MSVGLCCSLFYSDYFLPLKKLIYKVTVFSLKFSSEGHFPEGEVGSGLRDMATPQEELSSLKLHSLVLRPILCRSAVVIFRQQCKTFDSNNLTLSSMFFFQNAWPIKRKAVSTLVRTFPYLFFHFLDWIGSQFAYF